VKKILGLAIAALLVIGTVGVGTWAYFSDTETSSNNQITAGTLDLKLNGGNDDVTIMTGLTNKAPGNSGTPYATLKNEGSLPGKFSIQTSAMTDTEGTPVDSEFAVGALSAYARLAPWVDVDESGTFNAGDLPLKSDGSVKAFADGLQWDTWANFASKTWDSVIASMSTNQQLRVYLQWDIPSATGNQIQGDSCKFTVTFKLDQIP
jgi:predicted ribosomally synthesized peptide with SipW-like signal peptide